jgi:hypothetical protein
MNESDFKTTNVIGIFPSEIVYTMILRTFEFKDLLIKQAILE